MEINEITGLINGAAVAVHRAVGPGLLEKTYQACFEIELESRGAAFEREVAVPLVYKGVRLETPNRLDFLVEGQVVVELKAVLKLDPVFTAQLLNYMRLGNYPVGLLINFNVPYLGDGAIRRYVNRYRGPLPRESTGAQAVGDGGHGPTLPARLRSSTATAETRKSAEPSRKARGVPR